MRQSGCLILAIIAFMQIAVITGRRKPRPTIPKDCRCGLVQRKESNMGAAGDYVAGGIDTEAHEYPWQVRLVNNRGRICGGSIISDRWVLTAAHCLRGVTVDNLRVVIGSHGNVGMDGVIRHAKEIKRHPKFNDKLSYNYDVALIKLDPINFHDFKNVRPICLPGADETNEHKTAIVTGWGKQISWSGREFAPYYLKEVEIKVLSNRECGGGIADEMLCAGDRLTGISGGDSGGPLIAKTSGQSYEQIGVSSFMIPHASVFARVSKFMNWINKETGLRRTCPRQ